MSTAKDTSYKQASRYLASDQWMRACITEEFTYDQYCESARNNEKTVHTLQEFQDCREWMEEEAYFHRWPDLTANIDPIK